MTAQHGGRVRIGLDVPKRLRPEHVLDREIEPADAGEGGAVGDHDGQAVSAASAASEVSRSASNASAKSGSHATNEAPPVAGLML